MSPLKQEEGWIAFLDVLGTKNAVMGSNDKEGADKFASFFDSICVSGTAYQLRGAPVVPMSERDWTKLLVEPFSNYFVSRTTAFSDSFMVASADLDDDFFVHVTSIIQSAWKHELAIRGALAYGSYIADADGRPIRGVPIIEAVQWEAAQDWAWVSVSPKSVKSVAGESSFLREATVPSKQGMVRTYALRPRLVGDAEETGEEIGAEKLADITYRAWISARDSDLKDVCTKCQNTLRWLEQDGVGPALLERQDAEKLQLSFVDEEFKIRIRGVKEGETTETREPFLKSVAALARYLQCLDVQWDPDYDWCVLRVRYAGSLLRRHMLKIAVSHSFRNSGLAFWCDIVPAEIDLFKRDKENVSDPVKSLLPPKNLFTFSVSKVMKVTGSIIARSSLATGLIPATSPDVLIDLIVDCIVERDFKTASDLVDQLDTRVPPHVWSIAQRVLTSASFEEIVGLRFVPMQSDTAWWSNGEYWYNRAILFRELGQFAKGMESAALAVAFQPTNTDAWDAIGEFYRSTKNADLALRWHKQALRISPNSCRYRNHLGLSLMAIGRLDEAERVLIEAIKLEPDYSYAMMTLVWVNVSKGDGAAALRYVAKARAAGTSESVLLPAEAIASWVAKDFKRSLDTLKRAPNLKFGISEQRNLAQIEMHCLIEEGRGHEVVKRVEEMGEPPSIPDAVVLLYAQALISLGRSADARNLMAGREMEGEYQSEAEFVAELARREAGPYDSPVPNPVEHPLRRVSVTLCLCTIRRAAQYAIL